MSKLESSSALQESQNGKLHTFSMFISMTKALHWYWLMALAIITACSSETKSSSTALNAKGGTYANGASIVLFNQTAPDSIIGEPHDSYEGYIRSRPWSNDGPYPPKFFDLQFTERVSCDSLRVEMNGLDEGQTQELLTQSIFVAQKKWENSSPFLVKDIPFEGFFNAHPRIEQLNFHFTVYDAGTAHHFLKSFQLGASEGYLPEEKSSK